MTSKKTKKEGKVKTPKKTAKTKKAQSKPKKKSDVPSDDAGLIVIDDDISVDKNQELEERKAYLEEARSQETSD